MKIPRAVGLTSVVVTLIPALCRGFSLLSSSSSSSPIARRSSHFNGGAAGDCVRRRRCGTLHDNVNDNGETTSDRRKFLAQSSTAILVALAGGRPQSATAANDDMMMTPPRNRKIGGLALKLRAVTHVMVRDQSRQPLVRLCLLRFEFSLSLTVSSWLMFHDTTTPPTRTSCSAI